MNDVGLISHLLPYSEYFISPLNLLECQLITIFLTDGFFGHRIILSNSFINLFMTNNHLIFSIITA